VISHQFMAIGQGKLREFILKVICEFEENRGASRAIAVRLIKEALTPSAPGSGLPRRGQI